jgi:hypothetical protein
VNEGRGSRHAEMRSKGVGVSPVLKEDKPKWILGIAMHGVRQASGFLPRAVHVLEAQLENTVEGVSPSSDTSRDDEHLRTLGRCPHAIAHGHADLGGSQPVRRRRSGLAFGARPRERGGRGGVCCLEGLRCARWHALADVAPTPVHLVQQASLRCVTRRPAVPRLEASGPSSLVSSGGVQARICPISGPVSTAALVNGELRPGRSRRREMAGRRR